MQDLIDFFESLEMPEIQDIVFGDEEDLLARIRDSASYPCLFVSGLRKKFEGDVDYQLFAIYELQVEILSPNEKGDYANRLKIWKEAEQIMDKVFKHCVSEFNLEWQNLQMEWLSGFTADNLAGVSAQIPIKLPFSTCL